MPDEKVIAGTFTKAEYDAKPFFGAADTLLSKDQWLVKVQSADRIVASKYYDLNGKQILVWAFYAGLYDAAKDIKKIYKCAVHGDKDAHGELHGRLTYWDTAADVMAEWVKQTAEVEKAGGKEVKA